MRCEIIQDLLSCYIDHTCSEETRKLVEEHLKTCEECQALYKELSNVEYVVHPVINEKKPFVKLKRGFIKKNSACCKCVCYSFLIFWIKNN